MLITIYHKVAALKYSNAILEADAAVRDQMIMIFKSFVYGVLSKQPTTTSLPLTGKTRKCVSLTARVEGTIQFDAASYGSGP